MKVKGLGRTVFGGPIGRVVGSGGPEIGSCGFGSAPPATIATFFAEFGASMVIAGVDGVIVMG
jgi:hypothetical protein